MECIRGMLSSFSSTGREKSERSSTVFVENGSKLPEEFIASWNGRRCRIPIRDFSAEELIRATGNFDRQRCLHEDAYYSFFRGSFGKNPILVKKYKWETGRFSHIFRACAVRDLSIASQMRGHENALKVVGCCWEFENPVLVYEDVGNLELLSHSLLKDESRKGSLSWSNRVSVANDIARAVVYLHTGFSTPIIHRNLKLQEVVVDRYGVAKLFDFSLSIAIPPGESQVEDGVFGTSGFIEPQYAATGILSEKTDVYQFGMILLQLLTGERSFVCARGGSPMCLNLLVKDYVDEGRLEEIVDSRIRGGGGGGGRGGGGGVVEEEQLQAFLALALRCLGEEREDRPAMIEVAKELERIKGLFIPQGLNLKSLVTG